MSRDIFVGRETQLEQFKQTLASEEGAVLCFEGGPGVGKSTLLAHLRQHCINTGQAFTYYDLRDGTPTEGHDILRQLCQTAQHMTRPEAALTGDYRTVYTELLRQEDNLNLLSGPVLKLLELDNDASTTVATVIKLILGLIGKTHQKAVETLKRQHQNQPENFLRTVLRNEGKLRPVLFIDTFEHSLAPTCRLNTCQPDAEERQLNIFLNHLIKELLQANWRIVVAGRRFGGLLNTYRQPLNKFDLTQTAQMLDATLAYYQLADKLPAEARTTLLPELHQLSFDGNPLWLRSLCKCVVEELQDGRPVGNLSQLFATPPLFATDADRRLTKEQILSRVLRQEEDNLHTLWQIALPWRLDRKSLSTVFPKQDTSALMARIESAGLISNQQGNTAYLHEEVRDLLLGWAEANELRNQPDTRATHRRLLASIVEEHPDEAEIEWTFGMAVEDYKAEIQRRFPHAQDLSWMLEATFHAVFGSENLVKQGIPPSRFWQATGGSFSLSFFGKWRLGLRLEALTPAQLQGLLSTFEEELNQFVERFGERHANALRQALQRNECGDAFELAWWKRRIKSDYDSGSCYGYLHALSVSPDSYWDAVPDLEQLRLDLLQWLEVPPVEEERAITASALSVLALLMARQDQSEQSLLCLAPLLTLGKTDNGALNKAIAAAYVTQAITQGQLGRPEEAIATCAAYITVFADDATPAVRKQVAQTYFYQAITQGQLGRPEDEIATYAACITAFANDTTPAVREQVAKAYVNQAITQDQLGRPEEAIATYGACITAFADDATPAVREQVAQAYVYQAITQGQLGRPEDEIATYAACITAFANDITPAVREQVAKAYVNQAITQDQLGRPEEAIATYAACITTFADDTTPTVHEPVARARNGKGFTLLCQAKRGWAMAASASAQLSEALTLFQAALAAIDDQGRPMVLGNLAYCHWLLGATEAVEAPLRQALQEGGEQLRDDKLAGTEIAPVPQDPGFRALVERLWQEIADGK